MTQQSLIPPIKPSTFVAPMAQSALVSAVSYVTGQVVGCTRNERAFSESVDLYAMLKFMMLALVMTPFHVVVGGTLDSNFPSTVTEIERKKGDKPKRKESLSVTNVVIKLILSETIICAVSNALVVVVLALIDGQPMASIVPSIHARVPGMMQDSWRFWPMVSLARFTVVPPAYHTIFNNSAGFLWSVYCSLAVL